MKSNSRFNIYINKYKCSREKANEKKKKKKIHTYLLVIPICINFEFSAIDNYTINFYMQSGCAATISIE